MEKLKEILDKITLAKNAKQATPTISQFTYPRIREKEIMHSEILAYLLDPNQSHGLGDTILSLFMSEKLGVNFSKELHNTKVITERGVEGKRRIDILLVNGDEAIIIENKLNDAKDQKNQLSDYISSISEEGYQVISTVYLPYYAYKRPTENVTATIVTVDDLINILSQTDNTICLEYRNLLNYMNTSNINYMNALELQTTLSEQELAKLIDAAAIVNSPDWNASIFNRIKDELDLGVNLNFTNKGSYCQLYMNNYNFWVEIYIYGKKLELWITGETQNGPFDLCVRDRKYQFAYSEQSKGYYYYTCDELCNYELPNESQFKTLCNDVSEILKQSVSK